MPLGDSSCLAQNQTSICSLGLQRALTEDWVCVRCQSRNDFEESSGVDLLRSVG